jgi:hypothetical protein
MVDYSQYLGGYSGRSNVLRRGDAVELQRSCRGAAEE